MPLRFCLVLFTLVFNFFWHFSSCFGQKIAQVSVIVNSLQAVPDGQNIYMEGNMNDYNPFLQNKVELSKTAEGVWLFVMKFPEGAQINFNFTRGSEETIEVGMDRQPIGKRSFVANGNQILKFTVDRWKDLSYSPSNANSTTVVSYETADQPPPNRLRVHKQLSGLNLSPRDIYVWLPPDYHLEHGKHYPVLYVHQPHGIFNPNLSANNDWMVDETIDSFFEDGYTDGWIVVLIHNVNDPSFKKDDYFVVKPYVNFITQKIKPLIDQEYRTLPDSDNTMTIGSNMAGAVSFALAAKHPEIFGKAACLSPVLYFQDDYAHLCYEINEYSNSKAHFYFDCGSTEAETRNLDVIKRTISNLRSKGFIVDDNVFYNPYEQNVWSNRVEEALRVFR